MTIQIEFTYLVGILLAFFGFVGGIFKLYDRRQDERFSGQDRAREEGGKTLREMITSVGDRIGGLEDDQKEHGERLARLESDVKHVPTHEDITAIHKRIDEIQRDVGRLPGIERLLHGINDYLRDTGK
jgi:hypothetical protein